MRERSVSGVDIRTGRTLNARPVHPYANVLREWSFPAYVRERDALIVEAHANGMGVREIGRAVEMSAAQISRILERERSRE